MLVARKIFSNDYRFIKFVVDFDEISFSFNEKAIVTT